MNARSAAAAAAVALACTTPPVETLRGELIGEHHDRVRDCESGEVYALGVMSSVIGAQFHARAEEAAEIDPDGRVRVRLLGFHEAPTSSLAEPGVAGVFDTRSIVLIAPGACESEVAG